MTDFRQRAERAERLIEILEEQYWNTPEIRQHHGVLHSKTGYETHIPDEMRQVLIHADNPTARAVRFRPDYITGRLRPTHVSFMEYKATTTPRYKREERQWNEGQIEADALDHYLTLDAQNVLIGIVIYCSYHEQPLLCDYPRAEWRKNGRQRVKKTRRGSGTDYYNLDLSKLQPFGVFMEKEFAVPAATSKHLIANTLAKIQNEPLLQTQHHKNSPYRTGHETGFNWIR